MSKNKPLHKGLEGITPSSVIDKHSPVPLHHQLEQFLRKGIENGRFPANETLPTEHELVKFFDLSRTPVRQALGKLVSDGLVMRKRSLGTIVLPKPFDETITTLSTFTEEVQGKGQTPRARLIAFATQPADNDDVLALGLDGETQIYHIQRVRYIDDTPVGVIISHIPTYVAPCLEPENFTEEGPHQSIYKVLNTYYGIKLVRARESFKAVILYKENASLLGVPQSSPALLRSRVSFDESDQPIAFERGLYLVRYQLEWEGNQLRHVDTTSVVP